MSETKTYRESDLLRQLREELAKISGSRPGDYSSAWQEKLDSVVSRILEREEYRYDPWEDPLFYQYQDRYTTLGRRAMEDTLGQAAALTGGYGNSYAQLAGQQAYDAQLQGLYDAIPELEKLAMERYTLQGDAYMDQYGVLAGLEGSDYDRYRDTLADWRGDRDYAAGRVDAEREHDYGAWRDSVKDDQWQQEFDQDVREFNFKNKLGEFAPVASGVQASSDSSSGKKKQPEKDPMTKLEKKRSLTNNSLRVAN